jgi:uncharacterized protein
MGNPSAAHEPSMEEILASIRQIISEDGEQAEGEAEPSQGEEAPAAAQAADAAPEPEEIETDVSAAAPAPPPAGEAADEAALPHREEPPPLAAAPASLPEQQQRPEPTLRRPPAQSIVDQPSQPGAPQPQSAAAKPAPEKPNQAAMGGGLPAAANLPGGNDRLLSPQADASVSGAFSALAHTILAQNARTLEDLVSEMLRPMLKDWLDDNLPPLVERLVKEEIERVSRGRR